MPDLSPPLHPHPYVSSGALEEYLLKPKLIPIMFYRSKMKKKYFV